MSPYFHTLTQHEALPICAKWDRDHKYPEKQIADRCPVRRGSLRGIGDREALLWIHGAVDLNQRTHFQGGKSTPQPIKLVRHAGHGGWEDTARAALALSKMNWNNGWGDGVCLRLWWRACWQALRRCWLWSMVTCSMTKESCPPCSIRSNAGKPTLSSARA